MSSAWLVALLVAGLVAYLPALWGVFVFDDYPWIVYNAGLDPSAFEFWQRRPVTLLTFAANLYVAGPNPAGFHVVNIALHLANGVLVYLLVGRMVPRAASVPAIAAVAAAIFLLHPAQTGAVSYVSGRATSLMTFWLLIAHLAAMRRLESPARRWTVLSLGALVLAVGTKETALVYPALWIGWLVFGKGLAFGRSVRLAAPHLLVAAVLLAVERGPLVNEIRGPLVAPTRGCVEPVLLAEPLQREPRCPASFLGVRRADVLLRIRPVLGVQVPITHPAHLWGNAVVPRAGSCHAGLV